MRRSLTRGDPAAVRASEAEARRMERILETWIQRFGEHEAKGRVVDAILRAVGLVERPALTTGEAAQLLRCSKSNIRKLTDRHALRVDPYAKRIAIDASRLRAFVADRHPDRFEAIDQFLAARRS